MLRDVVKSIARSVGVSVTRHRSKDVRLFEALCGLRDTKTGSEEETHFLRHCLQWVHLSKAQLLQDLFVDFVLGGRQGVFCEFGATDGRTLSNSYFLESERGWSGILAEPGLRWHESLRRNRPNAIIDQRCVYSATGEHLEFNETSWGEISTINTFSDVDGHSKARRGGKVYMVETISLNDLLDSHGIASLDYLSVDTEGSELEILKRFDFKRFSPSVITVEHNFTAARQELFALLARAGYRRKFQKYSQFDDWYVLA